MPHTTSSSSLPQRVQHIIHSAGRPLSTREITERVYPEAGGATPVRISNVRRILQDLMHDGLLEQVARPDEGGRERQTWQLAAQCVQTG